MTKHFVAGASFLSKLPCIVHWDSDKKWALCFNGNVVPMMKNPVHGSSKYWQLHQNSKEFDHHIMCQLPTKNVSEFWRTFSHRITWQNLSNNFFFCHFVESTAIICQNYNDSSLKNDPKCVSEVFSLKNTNPYGSCPFSQGLTMGKPRTRVYPLGNSFIQ